MLAKLIERLVAFGDRMNPRERRLALTVLALVPLFALLLAARSAVGYVQRLDSTIGRLQSEIVDYNLKISKQDQVEKQYKDIAAQHSSAWSEAEILDRLKAELFRLAQKLPPELDEYGVPVTTIDQAFGQLVSDPAVTPGALRETGEGYKEFAVSLRLERDDLRDIIDYLERLQNSPQMLRIDRLDLSRIHTEPVAEGEIDITRTVVTGSVAPPPKAEAVTRLDAPPVPWELGDWRTEACATTLAASRLYEGDRTLEVLAKEAEARCYLERPLIGGAVYDMLVDIKADGPCRLGIQRADEASVFGGERMLPANGQAYRYHVQFTVPGAGEEVPVRLPLITLETAGAKALVESIVLQQVPL